MLKYQGQKHCVNQSFVEGTGIWPLSTTARTSPSGWALSPKLYPFIFMERMCLSGKWHTHPPCCFHHPPKRNGSRHCHLSSRLEIQAWSDLSWTSARPRTCDLETKKNTLSCFNKIIQLQTPHSLLQWCVSLWAALLDFCIPLFHTFEKRASTTLHHAITTDRQVLCHNAEKPSLKLPSSLIRGANFQGPGSGEMSMLLFSVICGMFVRWKRKPETENPWWKWFLSWCPKVLGFLPLVKWFRKDRGKDIYISVYRV